MLWATLEERCRYEVSVLGWPGRSVISAACAGALVAFAAPARAQEGRALDSRLAQSLFEQARDLLEKEDFAHACPILAESQRLDPGGGTLLNLAFCHEKLGSLSTAWAEYNDALSVAIHDERKDRKEFARERIAKLRPRLPQLRVVPPPGDVAGLTLRVDATDLGRVSLGVPRPLDPGVHHVVASAPGRVPWSTDVTMVEGQSADVMVPDLAPAVAPTDPARPDAPEQARVARTPRAEGRARTRLAAGTYVSGAVALTAFGTSIATGLLALSAQRDAEGKCLTDRAYCPDPTTADDTSRAHTLAWISTGALGVGVVATVVAILWPREGAVHVAPVSRHDVRELVIGTTF